MMREEKDRTDGRNLRREKGREKRKEDEQEKKERTGNQESEFHSPGGSYSAQNSKEREKKMGQTVLFDAGVVLCTLHASHPRAITSQLSAKIIHSLCTSAERWILHVWGSMIGENEKHLSYGVQTATWWYQLGAETQLWKDWSQCIHLQENAAQWKERKRLHWTKSFKGLQMQSHHGPWNIVLERALKCTGFWSSDRYHIIIHIIAWGIV